VNTGKPTLADLKHREPDPCPLCARPNYHPSDHHLVPRTRGGSKGVTATVCDDCHRAIHATFSNKELEREFSSVQALMAHGGFAKMIAFISKQDGRVHIKLSNSQRRRGRNG
jgi:Zn-finger protein